MDGGGGSSSGSGSSGSGTWGRSGPPKKEELVGGKKKGRTWGPSSTLQKEQAEGEERYGRLQPTPCPTPRPMATGSPPPTPTCFPYRLKALGEGSKQWSSSAPNLGKSPKHTPIAPGFASLNEMGKRMRVPSKGGRGRSLAEGDTAKTKGLPFPRVSGREGISLGQSVESIPRKGTARPWRVGITPKGRGL